MTLISIILPCFNSEKTIRRTIESVLNQTYKDFELIIVDDGSTDCSASLILNYKDDRIKYFFQNNSGQGAARNVGINKSTGKYISFIDSDDEMEKNFIETMSFYMETMDADLVECNYTIIEESKKSKIMIYKNTYISESIDSNISHYLKKGLQVVNSTYPVWNKMYKSELIKNNNIEFSEDSYNEDYLFNCRYLFKINKLIGINYLGYFYYRDNFSTTKSGFKDKDFSLVVNSKKVVNEVVNYNLSEKIITLAKVRLYHSYFSLFMKAYRYGNEAQNENLIPIIKKEMSQGILILLKSELPIKRKLSILAVYFNKNLMRIKNK